MNESLRPLRPPSKAAAFPEALLTALRELSLLPYENLSKILAFAERGKAEKAMVDPDELRREARDKGTGGTCFSLTYFLHHRLKEAGLESAFLIADKPWAREPAHRGIHCGLLFPCEGRDYLLDPGYLLFDPLPIPSQGLCASLEAPPNRFLLEDLPLRGRWRLSTGPQPPLGTPDPIPLPAGAAALPEPALKPRFDFKKTPVTEAEFMEYWVASFDFPMMDYPVLTRLQDGTQLYLQKRSFIRRDAGGSTLVRLNRAALVKVAEKEFGMERDTVEAALEAVLRRSPHFFRGS